MEFVPESEVMNLLAEQGVTPAPQEDDRVYLQMADSSDVVRVHLTTAQTEAEPEAEARVITVEPDGLAAAVAELIQQLRLNQVLLIPVSKWRHVFDAVAFSLAENEDWQEFETTATVELNTRDPLLCEPGDYQTIIALMRALLTDADRAEQGLMLATTAAPLLVEIVPEGAIRVSFGNQVLADEVADAFAR
ncbi:MAG: hypothetical protein SYC29_05965 [Planctomycetota bacterium]|nr:hypothetical protein [Planctomycetota bacterium]